MVSEYATAFDQVGCSNFGRVAGFYFIMFDFTRTLFLRLSLGLVFMWGWAAAQIHAQSPNLEFVSAQSALFAGDPEQTITLANAALQRREWTATDSLSWLKLLGEAHFECGQLELGMAHFRSFGRIASRADSPPWASVWSVAHQAWYAYLRIETEEGKVLADSVYDMWSLLSEDERAQHELYRIPVLVGQCYKQHCQRLPHKSQARAYQRQVRPLLRNAIAFQERHQVPTYHLVKAWHLLGNSYTDCINSWRDALDRQQLVLDSAVICYRQEQSLLESAGYARHPGHGRAALTECLALRYAGADSLRLDAANRRAFERLGYSWNDPTVLAVNASDGLMFLKHYLFSLGFESGDTTVIRNHFDTILGLLERSRQTWLKSVESEFAKRSHQNTGIYGLSPSVGVIELALLFPERFNQPLDVIFQANQHIKQSDVLYHRFPDRLRNPTSLSAFQQLLQPGTLVLDFVTCMDRRSATWLAITADTVFLQTTTPEQEELFKLFVEAVETDNQVEIKSVSAPLLDLVFADRDLEKVSRLMVSPGGGLSKIPFEAMMLTSTSQNRYLIEEMDVGYCLNLGMMHQHVSKPFQSWGWVVPEPDSSYSALPFARRYQQQWMNEFQSLDYTSGGLSRALLDSMDVLHFSSHGIPNTIRDREVLIVGKQGEVDFDQVETGECAPRLVVVNACNSADGRNMYEVGDHDFNRVFQLAGAHHTVTNLWAVDDQRSHEVLNLFYHRLRESNDPVHALSWAKCQFLAAHKEAYWCTPFYWAGNLLFSDAMYGCIPEEKQPLPTHPAYGWWILIIALLIAWYVWKHKP